MNLKKTVVLLTDQRYLTNFWNGDSFILKQRLFWTNEYAKQKILPNDCFWENERNKWKMNNIFENVRSNFFNDWKKTKWVIPEP